MRTIGVIVSWLLREILQQAQYVMLRTKFCGKINMPCENHMCNSNLFTKTNRVPMPIR